MQFGMRLRELWGLRAGVLASAVVGLIAAFWSVERISLSPLRVQPRSLETAAASTRVLVDTPQSLVLDLSVQINDINSITDRALLVTNVMASAPVRRYIARRSGVRTAALQVASPVTKEWPRALAQTGTKRSVTDILDSPDQYRLSLRSNPTVPLIDVYAQAPTSRAAEQLANGAVAGMQDYLRELGAKQAVPASGQVHLEQLGRAQGEVINDGASLKVAALSFLVAFAMSCLAALSLSRVRRGWVAQADADAARAEPA